MGSCLSATKLVPPLPEDQRCCVHLEVFLTDKRNPFLPRTVCVCFGFYAFACSYRTEHSCLNPLAGFLICFDLRFLFFCTLPLEPYRWITNFPLPANLNLAFGRCQTTPLIPSVVLSPSSRFRKRGSHHRWLQSCVPDAGKIL